MRGLLRAAALLPAALLLLSVSSGCSRRPEAQAPEAGGRLPIFVSIPPLEYLAQAVGGERVQVEVLVQPGQDPHTFEPTPRQMSLLAEARLFVRAGVDYENGLAPRLAQAAPGLRIVDSREGIRLRPVDPDAAALHEPAGEEREDGHEDGHDEEHDEEHDHEAEGADPHVWMHPLLALRQAQTIRDALIDLDPEGRAQYEAGYQTLAAELRALHEEIAAALAPYRGRDLFVYHPAFGYFADAYGLRQVAVETGGKEPSARQLAALIDLARARQARVIFVQPQFSTEGAQSVAEAIDGVVVPLDDLAADYAANLRDVARRVAAGLSGESPDGGAGP